MTAELTTLSRIRDLTRPGQALSHRDAMAIITDVWNLANNSLNAHEKSLSLSAAQSASR